MEYNHSSQQSLLGKTPASSFHELNDLPAEIHKCHETNAKLNWRQPISEWYLLCVCFLFNLAFTFGMVSFLDGKAFAVSGDTPELSSTPIFFSRRLTQPDVVTLISTFLVIWRTICAAWQFISAWRCVFILFEQYGLSIAEASCMTSWRLPPFALIRPKSSLGRQNSLVKAGAILVLLLAWPAQLSGPVAAGSVAWVPSITYDMLNTTLSLGTSTMPPVDHYWEHYMMFPTVRKAVVQRAAGLVSFAETANLAAVATADSTIALSTNTTKLFPVSSSARRMIPRLYSYTNGTVVDSAIVPIFEVNSFEWVKDIRTLPGNITKALKNSSSNYLTISENRSPLTQVIAGTSALLKDSQWTRKPADKLPDHRVYKGTKFAAIYVSRNWNQGENENYTCPHTSIDFGDVPLDIDLLNIPWNNNFSDCLAVAKLEITAGVTQCSQSDLSKSPRSTCLWAFNVLSTDNDNDTVSPDPLVSEVFAMMPEIQSLVVAISSYEPGILQGNLERFLRNSLIQAYQGGWSAMAEYLSPVETQRTTTSAWKPVILLEARVSSQRMYIWMGMGMTLVASGLLLMIIQATCKAKTVNNSLVAAVMLDSSEVARRDATGLCNAVDIGKGHGNAKLRLRLKVSDTSQSFTSIGSSYTHPRLVPDAI